MADTSDATDDVLPRESNVVTKEFLEETLKSAEKREDVIVRDFCVSRAIGKGENYAAIVLRVRVSCQIGNEDKTRHLIIKTMHDNDYLAKIMVKTKIFDKEVMAYKNLYPTFIQYQVDKGLEPIRPSVPAFYHSFIKENKGIIVLQDVCPDGYRMTDKRKGLDYEHCRLVMKALANIHALSYAVKDGSVETMKNKFDLAFTEAFYVSEMKAVVEPMYKSCVKDGVDMVTAVVENEKTKERVKKLLNMDIFDTQLELLKAEEPFSVICHGDAWCNNMMFKYDSKTDNNPTDVKLLDLQIIRYALPTTDLAYFFYTSTTRSLRQAHLNDLLQLYHKIFLETLNHVKVTITDFTFEVLENMFRKTMLFGAITACILLPHMLAKAEDVTENRADLKAEDLFKEVDEQRKRVHAANSQLIEERIIDILQEAVELGAL